jgi:hypothetical protein
VKTSITCPNDSRIPATVVYFYCDANSPEKQFQVTILGSLLRELTTVLASRGATWNIISRYSEDSDRSIESFITSLEWTFTFFAEIYLVIDGLDECSDRRGILAQLSSWEVKNLRILVTSRPEVDIASSFRMKTSMGIDDHVPDDIVTHVRWMMETDPKLCGIRPNLKVEIQEELIKKCDGMYLLHRGIH